MMNTEMKHEEVIKRCIDDIEIAAIHIRKGETRDALLTLESVQKARLEWLQEAIKALIEPKEKVAVCPADCVNFRDVDLDCKYVYEFDRTEPEGNYPICSHYIAPIEPKEQACEHKGCQDVATHWLDPNLDDVLMGNSRVCCWHWYCYHHAHEAILSSEWEAIKAEKHTDCVLRKDIPNPTPQTTLDEAIDLEEFLIAASHVVIKCGCKTEWHNQWNPIKAKQVLTAIKAAGYKSPEECASCVELMRIANMRHPATGMMSRDEVVAILKSVENPITEEMAASLHEYEDRQMEREKMYAWDECQQALINKVKGGAE